MPFSNNHISLTAVSTSMWNTHYRVGNRSPTCSPPGCIMWPVATFINIVYTIKIHKLRRLSTALITFPREAHCHKKLETHRLGH